MDTESCVRIILKIHAKLARIMFQCFALADRLRELLFL